MSENNSNKLPEVMVFAGPNGSGKSTITKMATLCSNMEAAIKAEELRENIIEKLTGINNYNN